MYDFLKFTKEEYADDLLSGKLYMNPLSFFKKIPEGDKDNKLDSLEGYLGIIYPEQATNYFSYNPMSDLAEKIGVINDTLNVYNIYCMYGLYRDEEKRQYKKYQRRC